MALVARESSNRSVVHLATTALSYAIGGPNNQVNDTDAREHISGILAEAEGLDTFLKRRRKGNHLMKVPTAVLPTVHPNYTKTWTDCYFFDTHKAVVDILTSKLTGGAFLSECSDPFVDQFLSIRDAGELDNAVDNYLLELIGQPNWDFAQHKATFDSRKLRSLLAQLKSKVWVAGLSDYIETNRLATPRQKELGNLIYNDTDQITQKDAALFVCDLKRYCQTCAEAFIGMLFDCEPLKNSAYVEYGVLQSGGTPLLTKPVAIVWNRKDSNQIPKTINSHELIGAMIMGQDYRVKNVRSSQLNTGDKVMFGYYVDQKHPDYKLLKD